MYFHIASFSQILPHKVESELSKLIEREGCLDNCNYVKPNIHTFTHRTLLSDSNKAFT